MFYQLFDDKREKEFGIRDWEKYIDILCIVLGALLLPRCTLSCIPFLLLPLLLLLLLAGVRGKVSKCALVTIKNLLENISFGRVVMVKVCMVVGSTHSYCNDNGMQAVTVEIF